MASEWRSTTLGEFVRLQRGHDLTEDERRPGNVPVMGSAGQNGFHNIVKAKGPGVVIGRSGASFGQVHFSARDYWPHNTTLYVTDFLSNDPRFVYYFLKAIDFAGYNSGSAQASLNRNFLYSIQLRVPPPRNQVLIANILSTLDDKIELNRRMNGTLESMARALFHSWFVDFDPVRAKQQGREPAAATLFPTEFVASELGEIPKDWEVKTLADVCKAIFSGGTPSTKNREFWDGGLPWLSSGETRNSLIIETEKTISESGVANSSTRGARAGCTVVASAGQGHTRGQTSLLTFDSYVNQSVVTLDANPDICTDEFVYLDTSRRYDQFRQLSDSHSSRGSLTTKLIGGVKLTVPPREVLREFNIVTKDLFARMILNLRESRTLGALRDALLPKLLSGEVSVADSERFLEKAL